MSGFKPFRSLTSNCGYEEDNLSGKTLVPFNSKPEFSFHTWLSMKPTKQLVSLAFTYYLAPVYLTKYEIHCMHSADAEPGILSIG